MSDKEHKKMISKKIAMASIIAISLQSPVALSAIPDIDFPKMAALMKQRIDEMVRHKEKMDSEKEVLAAEAEGDAAHIDAFNAGASGYVLRQTKAQSDLFNLRQLMSSLPAHMACETVSLKVNADSVLCGSKTIEHSLNNHTASNENHLRDVQEKIAKTYYGNETDIIKGVGVLAGTTLRQGTVSPEETAHAAQAALLLAPRYKNQYRLDRPPSTPEEVVMYNQDMRQRSINSAVSSAYNRTIAMTASSNPDEYSPSLLHRMQLEGRLFYNEDDHENTMAYRSALDPVSSPAQLYRNVALAKAKQISNSIAEYEAMLDDYYIQAIKLNTLSRNM